MQTIKILYGKEKEKKEDEKDVGWLKEGRNTKTNTNVQHTSKNRETERGERIERWRMQFTKQ